MLHLVSNQLDGSIPPELGSLANLGILRLSNNQLSGPIPPELAGLDNLGTLDLSSNQLYGEIPRELVGLKNLETLKLGSNSLTGPIPPMSSGLENLITLELYSNHFIGTIPPELGSLDNLTFLNLSSNQLDGTIPVELGSLDDLFLLDLSGNQLGGTIPPKLGSLGNLRFLSLSDNRLGGTIPRELEGLDKLIQLYLAGNRLIGCVPQGLQGVQLNDRVRLTLPICSPGSPALDRAALVALYNDTDGDNWTDNENWLTDEPLDTWYGVTTNEDGEVWLLDLKDNNLSGRIPSQIGLLSNLGRLDLSYNQLIGDFPSRIGQLSNLKHLDLRVNQLTGTIPPAIGNLGNVTNLFLGWNRLGGEVPAEIGDLWNLRQLSLSSNQLRGPIPHKLGNLVNLTGMWLSQNMLEGPIPPEFRNLRNLRTLYLNRNQDLIGPLPVEMTNLAALETLDLSNTSACAPMTDVYENWLDARRIANVDWCESSIATAAYLVQATQSLTDPIPLVAGEAAWLRVFLARFSDAAADVPRIRASFYQGSVLVHRVVVSNPTGIIPARIEEGRITWAARIPGEYISPGLEMVIEIDPDGESDPALGFAGRLPPTGRIAVDVRDVPTFELTLVPLIWSEDPDYSILDQIRSLTADSDVFRLSRDLLPVESFTLNHHARVFVDVEPVFENRGRLLHYIEIIRTKRRYKGHYMGVLLDGGGAAPAVGSLGSVSVLKGDVIAHELGHNMGLQHAPCANEGLQWPKNVDPSFPYRDGSSGTWGFDLVENSLVSPEDNFDVMSYCDPVWISDYHFKKAMDYRLRQVGRQVAAYAPATKGLLVWGGVNEYGELELEPAFVIDAPPSLPQLNGSYRLHGESRDGNTLFRFGFGMVEIADGAGSLFVFILPVQPNWPGRLARITVSGPEGTATIGGDDDDARTKALMLDPDTGEVRGILSDWLDPAGTSTRGRVNLPEPGLEIQVSNGIPGPDAW